MAHIVLTIMGVSDIRKKFKKEPYNETYTVKLSIAYFLNTTLMLISLSGLDLLIMLAYYRLSGKLSAKAKNFVM